MKKIDQYKIFVHFLAQTLGKNYEIVLHWKDKKGEYSIAAIENAEISGRTVQSPVSDMALEIIKNKSYLEEDFICDYHSYSRKNEQIKGSTYFIKDSKGDLQGLLCINFNSAKYEHLAMELLQLANLQNFPAPTAEKKTEENLYHNIEEIIYSTISPTWLENGVTLTQEKKIAICKTLDEKGVFNIKGAISAVANILGISEPSVYRYLKQINR